MYFFDSKAKFSTAIIRDHLEIILILEMEIFYKIMSLLSLLIKLIHPCWIKVVIS